MTETVYRFADPAVLAAASAAGAYSGEAPDRRDGFIHCSAKHQLADTLQAHFDGCARIALAEIDADALGRTLKWEASRGGDMFPHVYGEIPFSAIRAIHLLQRGPDGAWRLPEELS